jgi:hypothetical protein
MRMPGLTVAIRAAIMILLSAVPNRQDEIDAKLLPPFLTSLDVRAD